MHELLLHASIRASRHDQVLSILAGVAAMQPIPILEKHLVFKPTKPPSAPGKTGLAPSAQQGQMKNLQAQMQGDVFYLKLVGEIHDTGTKLVNEQRETNGDVEMGDDDGAEVR